MGPRAGPSGYMGAAAAPQWTMATGAALQRLAAGHAVPLRPRAPAGSVMPAFRVHIGAAVDAAAVPIPQRTAAERAVLQHVLPGAHLVAATAMQGKPGAGTLVCKFWLHAAGPHAVQAATAAQSLIAHRFISAPVPGLEQPVTVRVWQHTDAPPPCYSLDLQAGTQQRQHHGVQVRVHGCSPQLLWVQSSPRRCGHQPCA
jgi:hypothetical protein